MRSPKRHLFEPRTVGYTAFSMSYATSCGVGSLPLAGSRRLTLVRSLISRSCRAERSSAVHASWLFRCTSPWKSSDVSEEVSSTGTAVQERQPEVGTKLLRSVAFNKVLLPQPVCPKTGIPRAVKAFKKRICRHLHRHLKSHLRGRQVAHRSGECRRLGLPQLSAQLFRQATGHPLAAQRLALQQRLKVAGRCIELGRQPLQSLHVARERR